ncbi:MAG TPA: ABC transporter substrate-binding protein, partial [Anaerolineae bacterium]|nr:ABC transporter substrate-binding protein [Anaerolineae bacterium]
MVRRLLLTGLVALTLLSGCARGRPVPLAIGVRTANDHAPFYLARQLGYYQDLGLQAEVQIIQSNTEIVEAARRGDLQMGAIPVSSAIAAIAHGAPLVIVAMTGRGSDGLLVRADSGVTDLAGLRGHTIGTVRGSILDVLLRESLEHAGLDPERDVTLLYFGQLGDMIAALKTRQIDAASNTEPFMTQAERAGWGRTLHRYTSDWPDHPCCVVFCRRDLAEQEPGVVEKVLRAHVRAVEYANSHRAETAQAIAEAMPGFEPAL